jgi:hypothetical protein
VPVGSKQLALALAAPSSARVIYVCPAGFRAILKSYAVTNASSSSMNFFLYIVKPPAGEGARIAQSRTLNVLDTFYNDLWVVLEPGDELVLETGGITASAIVSGTELQLT